jgi:hypothetical protein
MGANLLLYSMSVSERQDKLKIILKKNWKILPFRILCESQLWQGGTDGRKRRNCVGMNLDKESRVLYIRGALRE